MWLLCLVCDPYSSKSVVIMLDPSSAFHKSPWAGYLFCPSVTLNINRHGVILPVVNTGLTILEPATAWREQKHQSSAMSDYGAVVTMLASARFSPCPASSPSLTLPLSNLQCDASLSSCSLLFPWFCTPWGAGTAKP